VDILGAVFCTVCSFSRFDLEMSGDHTVLKNSRGGLIIALHVFIRVSFCLFHDKIVRDFIMFGELFALAFEFLVCSQKVSLGLKVFKDF